MQTVEELQVTFGMTFGEVLDNAFFLRRFLIRNKLAVSAKETESFMDGDRSDSSIDSSENFF